MYGVGRRVFQGSNQYFVDLHKTGSWFLCNSLFRKSPSLIWTKCDLSGGCFFKFFDKSAFCTKARLCFCAMFYCVGFLKYHQTANTVTLNKSENAVGNIIILLRAFRRSDGAYKAAYEP